MGCPSAVVVIFVCFLLFVLLRTAFRFNKQRAATMTGTPKLINHPWPAFIFWLLKCRAQEHSPYSHGGRSGGNKSQHPAIVLEGQKAEFGVHGWVRAD